MIGPTAFGLGFVSWVTVGQRISFDGGTAPTTTVAALLPSTTSTALAPTTTSTTTVPTTTTATASSTTTTTTTTAATTTTSEPATTTLATAPATVATDPPVTAPPVTEATAPPVTAPPVTRPSTKVITKHQSMTCTGSAIWNFSVTADSDASLIVNSQTNQGTTSATLTVTATSFDITFAGVNPTLDAVGVGGGATTCTALR